jgi:hypothetical protein
VVLRAARRDVEKVGTLAEPSQVPPLRRSDGEDDDTPLAPVFAQDVAWRVFLSGLGVAALANVSPAEWHTPPARSSISWWVASRRA